MGAYDGADICELYVAIKKKKRFWNIELNRDIGVIVFKNTSWPELEKIKKFKKNIKIIQKVF